MRYQQIVTMDLWHRVGDFEKAAKPGDLVEESVVETFMTSLPPMTMTSVLVQCGEPSNYAFDTEKDCWRETYATFAKKSDGWHFCGYCFAGCTTEPKKIREGGKL